MQGTRSLPGVDALKEYFDVGQKYLKSMIQARKGIDKANASLIEWERVISRRGAAVPRKLKKLQRKPRKNLEKSLKYYKKAQENLESILRKKGDY